MAGETLKRKDKPTWFSLMDRVKAIRALGFGTSRELADLLGIHETRVYEYINHRREAKAEATMKIQEWVADRANAIFTAGKTAAYRRYVKQFSKE